MKIKNKVYIPGKIAMSLLIISLIYIILLTVHMFLDLNNNVNLAIKNGVDITNEEEWHEFSILATRMWIVQYAVSAIMIIMFVVYSLRAIEKTKIGKVFLIFWLIVWLGFAMAPPILLRRITAFDIITFILFFVIFIVFFLIYKKLEENKIRQKYERIKSN